MGSITYDGLTTKFDDRLLTHVQIVVVQQLRQSRSFLMSWLNALEVGNGRSSIWVHPDCMIRFTFDGSRPAAVDQPWLDVLTASANGPRGLIVTDAQGAPVRSTGGSR